MNLKERLYFEKLSRFRTPEKEDHYENAYSKMCSVCYQIRDIAKRTLKGFEDRREEKINDLLKEFQKLKNSRISSLK
jgi:uncharacterized protein (UPF0305 family)